MILHSNRILARIFLLLLTLAAALPAWAQVATATLGGVTKDATGAAIPGAIVQATQTQTNTRSSATTDSSGHFVIPALPVGPYVLSISASGFAPRRESGIVLTVGQVADVEISLSTGSVEQSVSVDTSAPLVDSSSPTIATTINQESVVDLPLNGRNPAALVFDVPGATDALRNQQTTGQLATNSQIFPAGITFSNEIAPAVNGVRAGGTYFSLDGASNVDPLSVIGGPFPDPDATQEFQVVTGTYGSRYVSAPGGAVNIVTVGGTNKIHGTVFEFIRNGYVNAENPIQGLPDPLKRNQFGGTVGGPVIKDKLFFFGSYQGSRIASQNINKYQVPTVAERQGIFTTCPLGTTCPPSATKQVNITTLPPAFGPTSANTESAIAANFYNYKGSGFGLIPLPNQGTNIYVDGVPFHSNEQQYVGRLDDQLTPKQRLFARYFYDHFTSPSVSYATTPPYNVLNTSSGLRQFFDNAALGHTWSLTQNLVAETRVSYLNIVADQLPAASNGLANFTSLGATNYAEPNPPGDTIMDIGSLIPPTSYGLIHYPRQSLVLSEDITFVHHAHELTFGGDYNRVHSGQNNPEGQTGVAVFPGVFSPILAAKSGLQIQDAQFADFFLGRPIKFIQGDGFFESIHGNLAGVYAQDKWRISQRLTATAGVRYDPFFAYTAEHNTLSCFVPGQQSTVFTGSAASPIPAGLIFPGEPNCPTGAIKNDYKLFEPRAGFAYQLNDKGTQTVRAGYGIYTMQVPFQAYNGFNAWPFARQVAYGNLTQRIDNIYGSNGAANPFSTGFQNYGYIPPSNTPFPSAQTPQIIAAFAQNYRPAYIQQYSLSFQNQFTAHDSLEIAYDGTKGAKLAQNYDANIPVGATSTNAEQSKRPYAFAQITTSGPVGWSKYNSLQVTVKHQAKYGIDLLSSFTWSKCRDNGSNPGGTGDLVGGYITYDQYAPQFNNGLCDFDQPYSWHTTVVYNAPSLKGHSLLAREALGSWILTSNLIFDSGQPFTVLSGSDNSYTNTSLDRADIVPGQPLYLSKGQLNYNAFRANAVGTLGNTGRNEFRTDYFLQEDVGVMKTFAVTERIGLLFRVEAFNVLNHENLFAPFNTVSSSNATTFDTYQGAHDPRQLQAAIKIIF